MADGIDNLYAKLTLLITSSASGRRYAARIKHLHTHAINLCTPIHLWHGAVYATLEYLPEVEDVIDGYQLFYEDRLVHTKSFQAFRTKPGDVVDLQYICNFDSPH